MKITTNSRSLDVQLYFKGETLSGDNLDKITKESYKNLSKIGQAIIKNLSQEIAETQDNNIALKIAVIDGKVNYSINGAKLKEITVDISKASVDIVNKIEKYAARAGLIKDSGVMANVQNEVQIKNGSNFLQKIFGVDLIVWIVWFISLKDKMCSLLNIPKLPSDIVLTVVNAGLGIGMLYEGIKSYSDAALINDEEGLRLAKYKILQGVITVVALVCLALVTYYLLPIAISTLTLTSGIIFTSLCVGYSLFALYNMRKNALLSKQINSFLNNEKLLEKEKLRGALAYLRDKITCENSKDHLAIKAQAVKLSRLIRRLDSQIVAKIKKADSIIEGLDRDDNIALEQAKELIKEVKKVSSANFRSNFLTAAYGILQAVILAATITSISLLAINILGYALIAISVLMLINALYSKFGNQDTVGLPANYEMRYKLK